MTPEAILIQNQQKEIANLRNQIQLLQEQLSWFQRQIFGKSSEKIVKNLEPVPTLFDLEPFEHPEAYQQKTAIAPHERKKRNCNGSDSITLPPNIPIERQVIDIPEEEKVCKETGNPLVKIGEEVTRKLAQRPGSYFVKEIIRPKYANPKKSEEGIRIAEAPDGLFNRCQADESLLADLITKKYADHRAPRNSKERKAI